MKKCSAEGYNLVIEGTRRNPNTPIKTANILKDKGYDVTLAVMAVPPTMSYFGTLTRYETMQEVGTLPRATTKEQHDQTAGVIVENIGVVYEAKVFDNIQLYNRVGNAYITKRKRQI